MQCMIAPTRKECDSAHLQGDWLDIGVASFRNLARIPWNRRIVWALLASGSIPIHFLYNSAIFKQLDNNSYEAIVVEPNLLRQRDIDFAVFEKLNQSSVTTRYQSTSRPPIASQLHDIYVSQPSTFDKLSPEKCKETYGSPVLLGHSHVIVVTTGFEEDPNATTFGRWPSWSDIGLNAVDAQRMPRHW